MESLFKNWKCRASSLGHLLTKSVKISEVQLSRIEELKNERDTGKNKNGNSVKWTDNKKEELLKLIQIRDAKEELPDGVKTHLDNIFRSVFWGRKRQISTNKMEKGTDCEPDSLQLISDIDGVYYAENTKQFSNDYITGEPDNFQFNIKEIKSNYDLESFENADLTSLYKWQTRAYEWMCGKTDGELIYCLVNNPIKQLNQAIYYLKLKHDIIDEPTEKFIKEAQQVERNMIFDIAKWNEDYPTYEWYNTEFDFDIPKKLRVKRFHVDLFPEHIAFIKKRIGMAREYLMEKEQAELEKIKEISLDAYNKQIQIIKTRVTK
jgi:hypothetical protein